jgi:hypothetical protein
MIAALMAFKPSAVAFKPNTLLRTPQPAPSYFTIKPAAVAPQMATKAAVQTQPATLTSTLNNINATVGSEIVPLAIVGVEVLAVAGMVQAVLPKSR